MPDFIAHYIFGQTVLAGLPQKIKIDHAVFDYALTGPDDWYFYFTNKQMPARAKHMHNQQTGEFLCALASDPSLFSYLAGFLCHYFLDTACHPYIISCTGNYDGTEATRQYLGNHMAFEKALDLKVYENNPEYYPVQSALRNKTLPLQLKDPLNHVYQSVFGWENVFPDLQTAKGIFLKYLNCSADPRGVVKIITGAIPHPLVKAVPYSRSFYLTADIFNESHRPWHHPKDEALVSTKSLPEMIDEARQLAIDAITAVSDNDLSLIGNRSYITGFDLSDPRNQAEESYQLLKRYS